MKNIITIYSDDKSDLLIHVTVAFLAEDLFHMQTLKEYAFERLKSQLHSRPVNELFEGFKEIYATQCKAERQVFIKKQPDRIHSSAIGSISSEGRARVIDPPLYDVGMEEPQLERFLI